MKEIDNEYPESLAKFENDIKVLMAENGVSEERAACYICNFKDAYICKEYNGGCNGIRVCEQIAKERLNGKV